MLARAFVFDGVCGVFFAIRGNKIICGQAEWMTAAGVHVLPAGGRGMPMNRLDVVWCWVWAGAIALVASTAVGMAFLGAAIQPLQKQHGTASACSGEAAITGVPVEGALDASVQFVVYALTGMLPTLLPGRTCGCQKSWMGAARVACMLAACATVQAMPILWPQAATFWSWSTSGSLQHVTHGPLVAAVGKGVTGCASQSIGVWFRPHVDPGAWCLYGGRALRCVGHLAQGLACCVRLVEPVVPDPWLRVLRTQWGTAFLIWQSVAISVLTVGMCFVTGAALAATAPRPQFVLPLLL